MKQIGLVVVMALLIGGVIYGGYYGYKLKNTPPEQVVYTDAAQMQEDIERLEGLKKSRGLSWQDAYRLGVAYVQSGRIAEAVAQLEDVAERRPRFYKTYVSLGMAYFRSGEYEKAVSAWNTAMELDPEQSAFLDEMIKRAERKIEFIKRIAELEEEIQRPGASWEKRFELATLYFGMKEVAKAREQLEEVVKSRKDMPEVYDALSRTYMMEGRVKDAADALGRAAELSPDNEDYKKRLSEMENYLAAQEERPDR
ncbi:MAG TPA: tetratricopeptide repeat protein [Deltaproteobacteria bacterium]|nr:tetratricopeptide repeat protein [Deltaproteobacteria bacterium]